MLLQGVKFASDDVIVTYTRFNRFNELSGFPNGDDNILSLTTTFVNKLNTDNLVVAELGDEIRHSYVSWRFFLLRFVNLLKFKFTKRCNLSK